MVALRFNASTVEPNRPLEPLPSGLYPVMISRTDMKPTSRGDGSYLEIEMTVQGGEFNGRKVFDRLNLDNPNPTAVQIAQQNLSAICHVTDVINLEDTQQLHGRPFLAVVNKQPRNDNPNIMTNVVKGYKNVDGSEIGFGGQPVQPQSQPIWAQPTNVAPFPQQGFQGQPPAFINNGEHAPQEQPQWARSQPMPQPKAVASVPQEAALQPQATQAPAPQAPAIDSSQPPPWARPN